jgi:hypothetical protein
VTAALVARLKGACRGSYRSWQEKALSFLLREFWNEQRASELHLTPTRSEVEHAYEAYVRREFSGGVLAKMLAETGMSVADEMLRVKSDMLDQRLLVHLGLQVRADTGNTRAQAALQASQDNALARLLSETTCSAWLLVAECSEYHGVMREHVNS